MIEVKNLSRIFNKGKRNEVRACDNISLKLEDTGFYVIFGKSGAGKSSFMNALGGLDDYSDGTISYDGKVFKHMVSDKCRVSNIGYIFQNYCLDANSNVYDNVALGLKSIGIRDEEVIFNRTMTALANVGMGKYFRRNVTTLSGGQQQRVAIARAMAKGSRIILADEPTGNLDDENTRIVMNILKELSKTRMVIVVTHEVDIVETYADKIIEIHDGKIVNETAGLSKEYEHSDKNKIFLQELEKKETTIGGITIEQYGSDVPIDIKVINDNGKLYLKADNANIKILDAKSEIKLINSTREEYKNNQKQDLDIQLQDLDPIIPKSSGKVFRYKDCIPKKNQIHTKKYKRRNKFLKVSLSILMVVIICVASVWGAYFNQKKIQTADRTGSSVSLMYQSETDYNLIIDALESSASMIKDIETSKDVHNRIYTKNGDKIAIQPAIVQMKISSFESTVDPDKKQLSASIRTNLDVITNLQEDTIKGKASAIDGNVVVSTGLLKSHLEAIKKSRPHYNVSYEEVLEGAVGSSISYLNPRYGMPPNGDSIKDLKITGVIDNENAILYATLNDINKIEDALSGIYSSYSEDFIVVEEGSILTRTGIENQQLNITVEDNVIYMFDEDGGGFDNTKYVKIYSNGEVKGVTIKKIKVQRNENSYSPGRLTEVFLTKNTANMLKTNIIPVLHYGVNSNFSGPREMGLRIILNDKSDMSSMEAVITKLVENGTGIEKCASSDEILRANIDNIEEMLNIMGIVLIIMYALVILISALVIFANFMEKTKEVGIYRAIGVSKGNCVYKYFVETLRTVIFYVFMIILVVGGLFTINSYFPLSEENPMLNGTFMFLSWWQLIGIIVLTIPVLMLISTFPTLNYVRKSPIKILSEYDM